MKLKTNQNFKDWFPHKALTLYWLDHNNCIIMFILNQEKAVFKPMKAVLCTLSSSGNMCFQTESSNVHHYILIKSPPPNMFGPGFVILAHSSNFSFLGKAVDIPKLTEDLHTHWCAKKKKHTHTIQSSLKTPIFHIKCLKMLPNPAVHSFNPRQHHHPAFCPQHCFLKLSSVSTTYKTHQTLMMHR